MSDHDLTTVEPGRRGFLAWLFRALRRVGSLPPEAAMRRMDEALRKVCTRDVHSAVMLVDAPRLGLTQTFAHGIASEGSGELMTPQTPFLSASVGKLVVAAALLDLVRLGRCSLEDRLTQWVPVQTLRGLPVEGGDDALHDITLAMLLAHRSGLPDYFSGESADGVPRLFDLLVTAPNRTWTRDALLDYARDHFRPAGRPGAQFHYADTNYDLLGLVLESVTGVAFHHAVRTLVLDKLSMKQTWYHAFEETPAGLPSTADVWVKGHNLLGQPCLTADQAGGGLVTTVDDLRVLVRALAAGDPSILTTMAGQLTPNAMHRGIDVGLCAWQIRPRGVFLLLAGLPTMTGHSGATGVWAYHVPDFDAVLVGAVSDASWQAEHIAFLLRSVLPPLVRAHKGLEIQANPTPSAD